MDCFQEHHMFSWAYNLKECVDGRKCLLKLAVKMVKDHVTSAPQFTHYSYLKNLKRNLMKIDSHYRELTVQMIVSRLL